MFTQYWHHTLIPGNVRLSHRFVLEGGDSSEPHRQREEIVLQSLDELKVIDTGIEHEYPQLRRRK